MKYGLVSLAVIAVIAALISIQTLAVGGQGGSSTGVQIGMDREVLGDLKGAIEEYRKIADGKDRALAGQALVRMAACYRKLGDVAARQLYEQVMRDFADQNEATAEARTGLDAPGPASDIRDTVRLSVVSDTSSVAEDGEPAVPYETRHPSWAASIPDAIWIWKTRVITNPLVDESHLFTKTFSIEGRPAAATLQIAADDDVRVTVNDAPIDPSVIHGSYSQPERYSVTSLLREGRNTISFHVTNIGAPSCSIEFPPSLCNPAGLLYRLDVAFVPATKGGLQ